MTKTYLHKKTGLTATLSEQNKTYHCLYSENTVYLIPAQLVEDSSDWVEILPKNEYPKIISFKTVIGPTDDNIAVLDERSGMYLYKSGVGVCLEDMLNGAFTILIWSVATSPTEIFTVGDRVIFYDRLCNIENMYYNEHKQLSFKVSLDKAPVVGVFGTSSLRKAKTPVFVSEDGASMFEGDVHYTCPSIKNLPNFALEKCLKSGIVVDGNLYENKNFVHFADRKTAVYYLFENKVTFSVQDIRKVCDNFLNKSYTSEIIEYLRNEYDKIA